MNDTQCQLWMGNVSIGAFPIVLCERISFM